MMTYRPVVMVSALAVLASAAHADLKLVPDAQARAIVADSSAVIAEDSLPRTAMRVGASARSGLRDDDTLDGSATAFNVTDRNWVIQWHWDESQLMPGIEYDIYARVKALGTGRDAVKIQGGVYDDPNRSQPVAPSTLDLAAVDHDRWLLIHFGSIAPSQQQFVWLAGDTQASDSNEAVVHFDRFILVPRLEARGMDKVLDARRANSEWIGFSLDVTGRGRLVLEFDGTPDVAMDVYASLGKRGRVEVMAAGWGEGEFLAGDRVAGWRGGAAMRPVRVDLQSLFPDAPRTRVVIEVVAEGERAVLFGAIASPRRDAVPLRAVWSDPPMGAAGDDQVFVDEQTKERSFRAHFDAMIAELREKMPGAPVAARVESATRKVYRTPGTARPRQDWLDDRPTHPAVIEAAANEYESFQIVLIPLGDRPIEGLTVSAGDWSGPGPLDPLAIHPVGYVEAKPLGYSVERGGWTPDPLMPNGSVTLPADGFQPIWCTAFIPPDAPPGRYETEVTVTLPAVADRGEVTLRIPVQLNVWGFALTDQTHLRTDFWFNRGYLNMFYGVEHDDLDWEVVKRWLGFHLDHRVTPNDTSLTRGARSYIRTYREPDGSITFDFSEQDRLLSYLLEDRHATGFNIAPNHNAYEWYDRWPAIDRRTGEAIILAAGSRDEQGRAHGPLRIDDRYRAFMTRYLGDYWQHLREKGWSDRAFHNMFDEPDQPTEQLLELIRISRDAAAGCPVLTTAPWDFFPDGAIDIHVPLTNVYDLATAGDRRARGEQTWWYVCSTPKHPHASFFMEYPAEDARILPWLSWKYGAQGLLYWGTNEWAGNPVCENVGQKEASDRWPSRPWIANPYRPINGEGYLLYPGPDMQPLASIRLVNLREGMEDYEYLWALARLVGRLESARGDLDPADQAQADQLLALAGELLRVDQVARSRTDYARHPEVFAAARREVARCILQIKAFLKTS